MFRILQKFILTTLFAIFASQASAMFIQPDWLDPTEPSVGTNRYSYSHNDPVNKIDPNGNFTTSPDRSRDPSFGGFLDNVMGGGGGGRGSGAAAGIGLGGLIGSAIDSTFGDNTVFSESNDDDGDDGNDDDGNNDPNGTPPDPADILSGIPGAKKCGSCKEWADEAKSRLDQAKIESKVVTVKSPTDFIQTDDGTVITTNGTHQGIQVGDTVFDNMNPTGMPTQGWLDNMGFGEGFGVGRGGWSISFD